MNPLNPASDAPAKAPSSSTTTESTSRNFLFFGVLFALLFITEAVFFIVAFQLPDDRLPELRTPAPVSSTHDANAQGTESVR